MHGHTPERIAVSIGVPTNYVAKIWGQRNKAEEGQPAPTPDQGELDKIREAETATITEMVAGMIRAHVDASQSPNDLVTVKFFQDIPAEPVPEPGMGETAINWLGHYWSTLGMIGLAAFSLVMLRSMIKAAPGGSETPESPAVLPMRGEQEEEGEESAEEAALKRLGRFSGHGPSLKDELTELVKEDPDAAASILRNWIGSVS